MTRQESKWNADAEVALTGIAIQVQSEEHLKHLIGYTVYILNLEETEEERQKITNQVFDNAVNKYNSEKDSVKYFSVNNTNFGVLLTFVRDLEDGITSEDGVLAWVENLDAPDCSELGYVYFQNKRGFIKRVA